MNGVYNSLKIRLGKTNSMSAIQEKSATGLSLDGEMERLERVVVERINGLKAAVKEGQAAIAAEAQGAQQLIAGLKANIAALEAKLKESEETVRKKDSSRLQIEETLK